MCACASRSLRCNRCGRWIRYSCWTGRNDSMARLTLLSPLAGWCLPVEEIPDPVFAQRMVGDGLGIDPTNEVLHAPCDGRVFPIAGASHALSLRTGDGGEVLLHVGIDTV